MPRQSAVVLSSAAVCVLVGGLAARFIVAARRSRQPRTFTVEVEADAAGLSALRRALELDRSQFGLGDRFQFRLSPATEGFPTATTRLSLNDTVLIDMPGDLSRRRNPSLPPYAIRLLRYVAGACDRHQDAAVASDACRGLSCTNDSTVPAAAGGPTSAPSLATEPASKDGSRDADRFPPAMTRNRSGVNLECGAVAGATPGARRRRTVEERVQRVALDVLAPAHNRRRTPGSYSGTDAAGSMPAQTRHDLPFDAFAQDAACAPLVAAADRVVASGHLPSVRAVVPNESLTEEPRHPPSAYVSALLYLMDVQAAAGDPVQSCRTVSALAAVHILEYHGGNLASVAAAFADVLGSHIPLETEAQLTDALRIHAHALASHAIQAHQRSRSTGPLAAGPPSGTLGGLLRPTDSAIVLLSFPDCSVAAVDLLLEIYATVEAEFGAWDMAGFIATQAAVWDRRATSTTYPSSWSRLFRSMNRSRSGVISFAEFATHFAKKVTACDDGTDPDVALVLCLARQRFLHTLFLSRRDDWHGRSFWFDVLVDLYDTDTLMH